MYKKILTFGIIFFLLFIIFNSSAISNKFVKNENIVGFSFRKIFTESPLITVTWEDLEEPIIPNTKAIRIKLQTTLKLTGPWASFVKRSALLRNKAIPLTLEIIGTELGVDATLENYLLDIKLGDDTPLESTLIVTVDEDAPANTVGTVRIRATSDPISGLLFGIKRGVREFEVGFVIGYWPLIILALPEGNDFKIPPLRHTKIPIEIENLGNAVTYVAIEIIDIPKNWNITFPDSIAISSPAFGEVNEKEIEISVKPPKDFSRNTIKISITPSLLGDPSQQGQTETLTLKFKNDGSYKEDTPEFLLIIIVIIVIILIILGSLFTIRRYFKK
jgi:hypothetical protein